MRLFLAAITIGAVGIGYVYTHSSSVPAAESATNGHLFDWQSADDPLKAIANDVGTVADEPPLVVRDTIQSTRKEITSVLDDFVRVNSEEKSVPGPSDIVSQADAPGDTVRDEELVPFATSEERPSLNSTEPSTSGVVNDIVPLESTNPESARTDARTTQGKPAINDATLITKKPPQKTDPNRTVRESELATKPKSELIPNSSDKSGIVDSDWKVIGKTSNGLPLHSRRFGRQGTRTLIVAGLDGQDLIGTRWNDELALDLERRYDLYQANEVLVLRAGNPDGLVKKTSANARGVLINRNFPSRRYQFLTDKSAGPGPASEVETHAIMEALYSFRPRRIIHLSSTAGRSTVIYNRAAKELALELQKRFQLNAQQLDVELVPGSVEDFADGTLDAAVISLKLNTERDWQTAWQKHLPVALAAINGQVKMNASMKDELDRSSPDLAGTEIPNPDPVIHPVKSGKGIYEELPPPPRQ